MKAIPISQLGLKSINSLCNFTQYREKCVCFECQQFLVNQNRIENNICMVSKIPQPYKIGNLSLAICRIIMYFFK